MFENIKRKLGLNVKYDTLKANSHFSNVVFLDLGASKIKMCVNSKCQNFFSSVRKVDNDKEVTIRKNAIKVNNKWFIVADKETPPSPHTTKYKKPYWEVMLLYGMSLYGQDIPEGDIYINLLLPYPQIDTDIYFKKKMSGHKYKIETTDGNVKTYNLYLSAVYTEGEMSKYYIDHILPYGGNTVVSNIGYSTVDSVGFDSLGGRCEPVSVAYGMRKLYIKHNNILSVGLSSTLSSWKSEGYKYNGKYKRGIKDINYRYVNGIMTDIKLGLLEMYSPDNTRLVLCGGGALEVGEDIKEWVKKNDELIEGYKVIVLKGDDAIYTDVLGMYLYVTKQFSHGIDNIKEVAADIDKDIQTIEYEDIETEDKGIKTSAIAESKSPVDKTVIKIDNDKTPKNKRKTYKDIIQELKRQGYTKEEVLKKTGASQRTIDRNWNVKK